MASSIVSGIMSSTVLAYLQFIRELPLTEERAERPHAQMSAVKGPNRANRPWRAATVRLPETLEFVAGLDEVDIAKMALEWDRYGRVVQTDPARAHRPVKQKPATFFLEVYENKYKCFIGDTVLTTQWQKLETGRETTDFANLIQTEYFQTVMKPQRFYTVGETTASLQLFQVVWLLPPGKKWVVSSSKRVPHSPLDVCLRFLSPWTLPLFADGHLPDVIEFSAAAGRAKVVEFLKLAEWEVLKETLREWQVRRSDVPWHKELHSAQKATPKLGPNGLLSSQCPFALIIERLAVRGWVADGPEHPLVPTTSPLPGIFSRVKMKSRTRPYFHCLLNIGSLFEKGLKRLLHACPKAYYEVLLRSEHPDEVNAHLTAEQYAEILGPDVQEVGMDERIDEDDIDAGSVVWSEHEGVDLLDPGPDSELDLGSAVGSGPGEGPKDDESSAVGSSSSGPDSRLDAESDGDASIVVSEPSGPKLPALALPYYYGGLTFDIGRGFGKPSVVVKCPGGHYGCRKHRGVAKKQTSVFGEWETIAFLLAWARKHTDTDSTYNHVHCEVFPIDVEEAFDELKNHLLAYKNRKYSVIIIITTSVPFFCFIATI